MNAWQQNLERYLQRIVRRVIRDDRAEGPLARRIRFIAEQEAMTQTNAKKEELIQMVVQRICNLVRSHHASRSSIENLNQTFDRFSTDAILRA